MAPSNSGHVLESQRRLHGEGAVLIPLGVVLVALGVTRDNAGVALILGGVSALAASFQVVALLMENERGLVVVARSWGSWRVVEASWDEIRLEPTRLRLTPITSAAVHGPLQTPPGASVLGSGMWGLLIVD